MLSCKKKLLFLKMTLDLKRVYIARVKPCEYQREPTIENDKFLPEKKDISLILDLKPCESEVYKVPLN